MTILALEFSTTRRSVAVATVGPEFRLASFASDLETPAPNGMVLVDRALQAANIAPEDISIVAVGLGPGSYAGIRSAIAIAQGWQLARDVRLLGLPSTEVIAAEAQKLGLFGSIQIVIDAQCGEFYQAGYSIAATEVSPVSALRIGTIADLPPESTVVGPGIATHISLPRQAIDVYPTAALLATLAAPRSDFRPGEALEPIYLRPTTFVKAPPPRFPIE